MAASWSTSEIIDPVSVVGIPAAPFERFGRPLARIRRRAYAATESNMQHGSPKAGFPYSVIAH
jgi:hypothetical protein